MTRGDVIGLFHFVDDMKSARPHWPRRELGRMSSQRGSEADKHEGICTLKNWHMQYITVHFLSNPGGQADCLNDRAKIVYSP
jgi:hypothetical protein